MKKGSVNMNQSLLKCPSASAPGGFTLQTVGLSKSEMGRLWFIKLSNLVWSVVQPLFIEVVKRQWVSLVGSNPCSCMKVHHFEDLEVNCVISLMTKSKNLDKLNFKKYNMIEMSMCCAGKNMKGTALFEDFMDLTNLDNFYRAMTLVYSHHNPPLFMRQDSVYGVHLVDKWNGISGGGLINLRNLTAHQRRARHWVETDFQQFFVQKVQACKDVAAKLYGTSSSEYAGVNDVILSCEISVTDLEMESTVYEVVSRMIQDRRMNDLKIIPHMFSSKHTVSYRIAELLRAPAAFVATDGTDRRKILCIPPLDPTLVQSLHHYQARLKFLRTAEWACVCDFSGLKGPSGEAVSFFDPLPEDWVTYNPHLDDNEEKTVVYLNKDAVHMYGCLGSAQVFVPLPSESYLSDDPISYSPLGRLFGTLDDAFVEPPVYLTESFGAVRALVSQLRKYVYGELFSSVSPENAPEILCSFPLLDALCSPRVNQVMLPSQVAGIERVIAVPADLWKLPHSELLHFNSGTISVDAATLLVSGTNDEDGSEDEDGDEDGDSVDEDSFDANLELLEKDAVQKQLKDKTLSFVQGECPADWALFRHGVVKLTDQLKRIQEQFSRGELTSFTLTHTFGSGGSTLMRHLLYSLREKYVCVSIWDFDNLQELPALRTALYGLHDMTDLDVVVLVDLSASTEYGGIIKAGLWNDLKKLPYVRLLVCEHVSGRPTTTPSAAPASDLTEQLEQRTEGETHEINLSLRMLCDLEGRSLSCSFDTEGPQRVISDDYFKSDGLLNTLRIKKEAGEGGAWQFDLIGLSRSNPDLLSSLKYCSIEVLELSGVLDRPSGGSPGPDLKSSLSAIAATGVPLINIGLLLFGSPEYTQRVKLIVQHIVAQMNETERFVLQTVVFAALFAPGLKLDKSFVPDYTPSLHIMGLVSITTEVQRRNGSSRKYLAINVPKVAYILAEIADIFNASQDGPEDSDLYNFLTRLLRHLNPGEGGTPTEQDLARRRRALIRPILHRAFVVFSIWHWLPPDSSASRKFSFLINFLWKYHSSKNAATNMFCKYSEMIALDNRVLLDRETRLRKKEKDELAKKNLTPEEKMKISAKYKTELAKIWSGEHAKVVIAFLTNSSRLREDLAFYEIKDYREKEKEYQKCLNMLNTNLVAQMTAESIFYRYATVHRRRLESYKDYLKKSSGLDEDYLKIAEDMCMRAEDGFERAIAESRHSWAYPLVGLAQCRLAMYQLLLNQTKRASFDHLVDYIADKPDKHHYPTITAAVSVFGIKQSIAVLAEANIASTYIRLEDNQEKTRQLVLTTTISLRAVQGENISPLERAMYESKSKTLFSHGEKCVRYLLAVSQPLAVLNDHEDVDTSIPSWKGDLEYIVQLSAAAHVTSPTFSVPWGDGREGLEYFLQTKIVWLISFWKAAVHRGKAHGLFRAYVMLAVYYKLNPGERENHEHKDIIPSLYTAVKEASAAAKGFQHTGTVRCFIADKATLPLQPLACFYSVEANAALIALKKGGRRNVHADWATAFQSSGANVRLLTGTVCVDSFGKSEHQVYCNELDYKIRYHPNNHYILGVDRDPPPHTAVKFAVGINDHSLWAYGLHE